MNGSIKQKMLLRISKLSAEARTLAAPGTKRKKGRNRWYTRNYFPHWANEERTISREFMSYLSRNFHSKARMWILASPRTSIGHSAGKHNRCGLPKRRKKSTDQSKHWTRRKTVLSDRHAVEASRYFFQLCLFWEGKIKYGSNTEYLKRIKLGEKKIPPKCTT